MSAEKFLIAQSSSSMFTNKVNQLIRDEIVKGCSPDLYSQPVALEPFYEPLTSRKERATNGSISSAVMEFPVQENHLKRFQIWLSPEQVFDWNYNELFVKQLYSVQHRVGFEILGNSQHIRLFILCHKDDAPVIQTAFGGQFECGELTELDLPVDFDGSTKQQWQLHDYYPLPPYSHLLTRPNEFKRSPLENLIHSLSTLSSDEFLWYQVLLQPVAESHNWHHNIELLLDLEYHSKLMNDVHFPHRFAQQMPSGDLHHMSQDTDHKAHNDKPMFAAAVRILYLNRQKEDSNRLHALSTFMRFFQHGGRPLQYLTEKNYQRQFPFQSILEMFRNGITYRPGFIVNSLELTGLVHVPPSESWKHRKVPLDTLETLYPLSTSLTNGTHTGIFWPAYAQIPI